MVNGFAKKKFIPALSADNLYFSSELADMPMIKSAFTLSDSSLSSLIKEYEGGSSSGEGERSVGDACAGAVAVEEVDKEEVVVAMDEENEHDGEGQFEEFRVCRESSYCL